MPSRNPLIRAVHAAALRVPPLMNLYRYARDSARHDPLANSAYSKLFERKRLTLPSIDPEKLAPNAGTVVYPAYYPLFAGEDAPLPDMLFLMNLARGRQSRRILEVGTYRARTTLAFHLNCPDAEVVSYDIQVLNSPYRQALEGKSQVQLRHGSFAAAAPTLKTEDPYDLIFVDGSHFLDHVLEDSKLALEITAPGGVVVWHDYRLNGYHANELRVPEALHVLQRQYPVFSVRGTTCAVFAKT